MDRRGFLKGVFGAAGAAVVAAKASRVDATGTPPATTRAIAVPGVRDDSVATSSDWESWCEDFVNETVANAKTRPFPNPPGSVPFDWDSPSDRFARLASEPTVHFRFNNGPPFAGRIVDFGPFEDGKVEWTIAMPDGEVKE